MKVFDDSQRLAEPIIRAVMSEAGNPVLAVVDEKGRAIANLIEFGKFGAEASGSAQYVLEDEGIDTSFAEWNESGRIILHY